ncbi:hypothetical protein M1B72_02225 [Geomonas paludis]|uniref:DUF2892 domain-containing protein n=1 Tax=Geomonas paludis TaxID=2740185 RepID=A0ABY4LG67_9BACT|nr:hypothetical protein [Geomonas paludis]UPU36540.1 hypothetical protein M1B72_02225 [Geomonas paludis]
MRPDNANAMGMIAILISTLGLLLAFGKMQQQASWGKRIAIALLTGFFPLVFSSIGFGYKCPSSYFSTGNRGLLFAACAMAIGIFIQNRKIVVTSCIVIVIAGFKLNMHYDYLVNKTGQFGYVGTDGHGYNQACPDEGSPEVKLRPIWHSRLTEVYKVEQ